MLLFLTRKYYNRQTPNYFRHPNPPLSAPAPAPRHPLGQSFQHGGHECRAGQLAQDLEVDGEDGRQDLRVALLLVLLVLLGARGQQLALERLQLLGALAETETRPVNINRRGTVRQVA